MDSEKQKLLEEAQKYVKKMEAIIDWAEDDEWYGSPRYNFEFKTDFIESVLCNTIKYKKITDKQKKCIDNIYKGFNIQKYVDCGGDNEFYYDYD